MNRRKRYREMFSFSKQTFTVESAPFVTGLVFMQRFRLFLGDSVLLYTWWWTKSFFGTVYSCTRGGDKSFFGTVYSCRGGGKNPFFGSLFLQSRNGNLCVAIRRAHIFPEFQLSFISFLSALFSNWDPFPLSPKKLFNSRDLPKEISKNSTFTLLALQQNS